MFKCRVLDNILSGISENKIQHNEVVLYFGVNIWCVEVNGFFAGGSIFLNIAEIFEHFLNAV